LSTCFFRIDDEVHLLPAPVFQITATLQARRRLGLTATLVREDGREDEVFALIGPKKYDVSWKDLERQGWIAKAKCTEIRLPLSNRRRLQYAVAQPRHQFRVASENRGNPGLPRLGTSGPIQPIPAHRAAMWGPTVGAYGAWASRR